jgi:type IV pilus assembly protein PilA
MGRAKPGQSGFSVIELLVVVGLILLIAAIALPNLFDARKKANEASAVASIHAIQTAESVYQNTYPDLGYSGSLVNLGNNGSTCETLSPTNACLLDPVLSTGLKDSYLFDLLGDGKIPDQSYTLSATPQSSPAGGCSFFSDQAGAIQSSPALQSAGKSGSGTPGGSSSCGAGN